MYVYANTAIKALAVIVNEIKLLYMLTIMYCTDICNPVFNYHIIEFQIV